MSSSTIDIGLDIGKSFISGFFARGSTFVTQKVPISSAEKLPARLEKCLENGATSLGLSLEELLKRTRTLGYTCREEERIIHDKIGPRMGLIVTKGSEGTLYARGMQKTPKGVFVPEELILGIDEKVDARGNVRKAIKKEEIFEIAKVLLEALTKILGIKVNMKKLNQRARKTEKDLQRIQKLQEEQIKALQTAMVRQKDSEDEIPKYIR